MKDEPKVSQAALETAKDLAYLIWQEYDDTYGYASKKIEIVKESDSMWTIWNLFDWNNQTKFTVTILDLDNGKIKKELRDWILYVRREEMAALIDQEPRYD